MAMSQDDWQRYFHKVASDGENGDEEEEDFYGYGTNANGVNGQDTTAGALSGTHTTPVNDTVTSNALSTANLNQKQQTPAKPQNQPPPASIPTPDQKRAENQRKAELLRAKLMANRQNTPSKTMSRSNTPVKIGAPPSTEPVVPVEKRKDEQPSEPSSDWMGLENLLAEGKAAAEANVKEQSAPEVSPIQTAPTESKEVIVNGYSSPPTVQQNTKIVEQSNASSNTMTARTVPEQPKWSTKLTDSYYADLSIWLEYTGYHDVEYRNSVLSTYKKRKLLEAELAEIQERYNKFKQEEQATIQALRTAPGHATTGDAPALPLMMPNADAACTVQQTHTPASNNRAVAPQTHGTKRAHSPEPIQTTKARRGLDQSDFRIRGANDSPTTAATRGRPRSPGVANAGLERRISYPDARRRPSVDRYDRRDSNVRNGAGSRDPSLERHQNYYKRETDSAGPVPAYSSRDRYDREAVMRSDYETRGRPAFSNVNDRASVNVDSRGGDRHGLPPLYRGSAGLDLRKGGVRYFMIKSWNHDNVATAMRDNVWATQEKNEKLLTDAFKTSRHVILLFSVNKSVAFQGYALMTSPPDPSLPKPPFCAKLNWGTSPAFSLRWLSTTQVHFRHVGHLKNEYNRDDDGKPHAVLVGKDGQEISAEAGMGLVWILDEVEETERGKAQRADDGGGNWRLATRH